jgi:hypothetical protein
MKKLLLFLLLAFPLATFSQEEYSLSLFEEFTGEAADDWAGSSVASAGDVNNDGYDDILIGAYGNDDGGSKSAATYLIYGQSNGLVGASLSEATQFTGEAAWDYAGWSVASAGDVNNDDYDDIIIGAFSNGDGGSYAGAAYLIYGQAALYTGTISLADADAEFTGEVAGDDAGWSVSSARDINNDGYDDFLISADYNDDGGNSAGAVYLIYGQATPYSGTISLSQANAEFIGEAADDRAGWSISSAGDVNNDGYDDILIGADSNDDGGSDAGAAYIIYGQATKYSGTISLADADAEFTGEAAGDSAGWSVSSAGDLNNDGFDDFLIGAYNNDDAASDAGAAYFIYGQSTLYTGTISLADVNAEFTGEADGDMAGYAASSVGDVNGDGYDDVLVGAQYNSDGGDLAGSAYLIYGQAMLYSATISLSNTDMEFTGEAAGDWAGSPVASAGDMNNDGYDDILVGAGFNNDSGLYAGAAYLGYLYIDADHDGLTGPSILSSGTDINDNDHDNDGIETDIDCNDDDINVLGKVNYYQDLDNDGLGNNAVDIDSCSVLTGYATNNTDLNDIDHDNDGVNTLNDCNDDDNTISEEETYYKDGDNDNRGNPDKTIDVCSYTAPTGYVANDYKKYNEGAVYVRGTKKGAGIVSLYDINNVKLNHWKAFLEGGVTARLVAIKNTTYVLAIKRRSGSTMHMYNTNGDILKKERLSPRLHWRKPAIGNLNNQTNTEEIVISAQRGETVYFRVYSFNPTKNTFTLEKQTSYQYLNKDYRVEIQDKHVVVLLNHVGKKVFSWVPFEE